MSHGTGRHRRCRRGWVSRVRWAVGAVLATIIGVGFAPPSRPAELEARKTSPQRKPPNTATTRPAPEPEWVRRYDEARRSHTDRAWSLFTEGSNVTEPDTPVELPEFGWCVDEDGVRAVRPYLVAHEQRQRSRRRRPAPPISPAKAAGPRRTFVPTWPLRMPLVSGTSWPG
ncbi:hypothetical protein DFP74_4216 [Nocardiopsis sp. Huas11]|nr:hypothetical protein DFP74_4216 [Nocardiopsis sp. Huas11]